MKSLNLCLINLNIILNLFVPTATLAKSPTVENSSDRTIVSQLYIEETENDRLEEKHRIGRN